MELTCYNGVNIHPEDITKNKTELAYFYCLNKFDHSLNSLITNSKNYHFYGIIKYKYSILIEKIDNRKTNEDQLLNMPVFFSNSQNKDSKDVTDNNKKSIEINNYESVNSRNISIANLNTSKDGVTPHANKVPFVVNGNPDKYTILKRNGKFGMCRLLGEDSKFNSSKIKIQNLKQK